MKKKIVPLLLSFLFAMAPEATAQDNSPCCEESCCVDTPNIYAKIFGGANFLQNTNISGNSATYDIGYVIAGSLGYGWCYGLHWEFEYAFRRNPIKNIDFFTEGSSNHGHFQTSSYMVNMLWYLPLCSWGYTFWNIRPLVGAGIGYDSQQMHASNSRVIFDQHWHHFSWQLMAGLAYPIFCNTELTVEYQFHQGGSNFNNHAIGVWLTYRYNLR